MKFAMLLLVVCIAIGSIKYVSSQDGPQPCLTVDEICSLYFLLPLIISCVCYLPDSYPQFESLNDICNNLTFASELDCYEYNNAVTQNDDTAAGMWLSKLITIGTNGNPDSGPVPDLITSVCSLITQLQNDRNAFCDILSCVLNTMLSVGYFLACLIISAIKQIGKPSTVLSNYLIALLNQIMKLLICLCVKTILPFKNCTCLDDTINLGKTDLGNIKAELNNLLSSGKIPFPQSLKITIINSEIGTAIKLPCPLCTYY